MHKYTFVIFTLSYIQLKQLHKVRYIFQLYFKIIGMYIILNIYSRKI